MSVTIFLMLTLMASQVSASTTVSFTVTQISQTQFLLPAKTILNGSLFDTSTLRCWVSAPDGSQIVNLGLIDHFTSFGFMASQYGNYTLNFENGLPIANPVQVTFTYSTDPEVTSNHNSTGTSFTYWVVVAFILVLGTLLIVFLIRRKKINGPLFKERQFQNRLGISLTSICCEP
jgi:LPXTG-motif cell wall-anchored protein